MRDGDTRATGIPDLTDELVGDGDELDDDPVAALLRSVLTPTPAPAPAARTTTTDPIHPPQPASTEFDDLWIDAPRVGGPSPIPLLDQLDRLRPTDDVDRDPRSLRRLTTAGVAVVVAAVGFVGMSSVVGGAGPGDPAPVSAAPFASSAPTSEAIAGSPTTTSAPTSTSPDPTASGAVADDGAAPAPIVEHEGRRFQVGEPGDLTAVADWRCDGRQTLALYRPATGATFVFDSWPRPGERAETTAVVVAPGGSGLEPGIDGTGCPTLSVVGTTGPLTTLTVEDLR